MLRSGGEAIRYAHDHGLRRAAWKFFRTYIFARRRVYLTHNDLLRIAALPLETRAFEVRLARPDDALAEAFPHLKRSTIGAWLRPDHFFFVVLLEGTLVGYRCLSTRAVPSLNRFLRLRSHQLFAVNMYTRPEHRRRGFTRIAKIAAARDLVRRGFLETFSTEGPTNYSTLIANPRTGSLRIGTLTRTCTLGWARFALTPTTIVSPPLVRRQLALLKRVAPAVSHAGVLFNPSVVLTTPETELETQVTFLPVREAADQAGAFNEAFSTARAAGVNGLIVLSDPMMKDHRRALVALVDRHRLPTIFDAREFVAAGGLMACGSPGPCLRDFEGVMAHLRAITTDGHPPALAGEPDLIVNNKVATALGLGASPAFR